MSEVDVSARSGQTAIQVAGLGLKFANNSNQTPLFEVFRDLSFDVDAEEFVTVIGRSGCGKTTLLKVIGGLLPKPHHPADLHGKLSVWGRSPREAKQKREFGIVFQSPRIFPWLTCLENVRFPLKIMGWERSHWDPDDLLEIVGLQAQRDSYPQGLSGGEQQRLAIARALLYKPTILLMDEPFAALDDITRQELSVDLLAIKHETEATIVFVTHNLRDALFLSDRVIVMKPSQPHEQGGPSSRIQRVVPIAFSAERNLDLKSTVEFNDMENELRKEL